MPMRSDSSPVYDVAPAMRRIEQKNERACWNMIVVGPDCNLIVYCIE
jgi:hypothetical protein